MNISMNFLELEIKHLNNDHFHILFSISWEYLQIHLSYLCYLHPQSCYKTMLKWKLKLGDPLLSACISMGALIRQKLCNLLYFSLLAC